jgi:hypothetical protein
MKKIDKFLTSFSGQTFSSNKEAMDWLREGLVSFEKEASNEGRDFFKKELLLDIERMQQKYTPQEVVDAVKDLLN